MPPKKADIKIKREIIKTSVQLASEMGWNRVSIRKISECINYSTIMIYSFFGSKEKLFIEIRDYGFSLLLKRYETMDMESLSHGDLLRRLTKITMDFYKENKELYQLMFGIVGIQGITDICVENAAPKATSSFIRSVMGRIFQGESESMFYNWWALIQGFISISNSMDHGNFNYILHYMDEAVDRLLGE